MIRKTYKFGVLDGTTLKLYENRPTVFPSFEISLENVKIDFRDNGILNIEADKILYDLYHGYKVYENEWINQPHIREIHEGIRWWKKLFGIKKKERFVYGGWVRANKVEKVRYSLNNFKIEYCD